MIEADILSDHIAIMNKGKIIAQGTSAELKRQISDTNNLELEFHNPEECQEAQQLLKDNQDIEKIKDLSKIKLFVSFHGGIATLKDKILEAAQNVKNLSFREPTLEDVFLELTGRSLRD
jgi:ABC-2 type transport system ATP-binding protein